jgi:hypothetical protein
VSNRSDRRPSSADGLIARNAARALAASKLLAPGAFILDARRRKDGSRIGADDWYRGPQRLPHSAAAPRGPSPGPARQEPCATRASASQAHRRRARTRIARQDEGAVSSPPSHLPRAGGVRLQGSPTASSSGAWPNSSSTAPRFFPAAVLLPAAWPAGARPAASFRRADVVAGLCRQQGVAQGRFVLDAPACCAVAAAAASASRWRRCRPTAPAGGPQHQVRQWQRRQ